MYSRLRDNFSGGQFGLMKFSFLETEMKIEARMNKKRVFAIFGTIIGIAAAISVGLAVALSEWAFLAILIIPLLIVPFGFLEINEKLVIDSQGVSSSGVVWPRPCKIPWAEIGKIVNSGIGVMFYKAGSKAKVLFPFAPEIIYVVQYYQNAIAKQ